MESISDINVSQPLREDELADNLRTKFLGASSDDDGVIWSQVD